MSLEIKIKAHILFTEIYLYVLFFLSLCFGIALYAISKDSSYISHQYKKNWYSNYIVDITISTNGTCPQDFEQIIFGTWSGFPQGSCVCTNDVNSYQTAFENNNQCNDKQNITGLNCMPLDYQNFIYLSNYKNAQFCIKRGTNNFATLYDMVGSIQNDNLLANSNNSGSQIYPQTNSSQPYTQSGEDYYNFELFDNNQSNGNLITNLEFLNQKAPNNYIDPMAIIDIKLLNTTMYTIDTLRNNFNYDLTNYTQIQIGADYSMFFKRISNDYLISDVNKLIIDIHLSNQLWCGFLDISPPKGIYDQQLVNFGGFEFCEDMFKRDSTLFYFDNFKRTEAINFDFDKSVCKMDFYDSNGISDFYNNKNINTNRIDNFPPILVYEKYFSGMGCPIIHNIDSHIHNLNSGFFLRSLTHAHISFNFLTAIFGFFFLCCKVFDKCSKCNKIIKCNLVIIWILFIINFLISLAYALVARRMMKYLQLFSFYCQTDFNNQNNNYSNVKTNSMELQYYNNLDYPSKLAAFLSLIGFGLSIFGLLYIIFVCCTKKVGEEIAATNQYGGRPSYNNIENREMGNVNEFQDINVMDKSENSNKVQNYKL